MPSFIALVTLISLALYGQAADCDLCENKSGSNVIESQIVLTGATTLNGATPVKESWPSTTYTNAGKAYMGWHSTQVQQFTYGGIGSNLSEQFLKNQTDWMARNFKNYGYDWICLDGWLAGTRHNPDGYVTTQSDTWTGGWTEMAGYVHSKRMKFGIYHSPGWVLKSIADDEKLKIKGTNFTIKSITRGDKTFEKWYQIDTTKPGAQNYIQGMVDYFIGCGVDLLKIDFLREYEQAYGHAQTMTLLDWTRQAAGNRLILTLCLPIGHNHLEDERKYGDNIRVVGDYVENLWYHTSSDSRGTVRDFSWPMASNVFDGLAWSSDITGKGKFIASPDFVTYHNNATDAERKFATTIRFISGAAVEFGDCYSDIGGDVNANYLRNSELTSLNAEGFFGKPLTRTLSDSKSQIWEGTTANGDRVVALFNRDDTTQTRSVDFKNDLGLSGNHQVRDLWTHSGIGNMSSYSVDVPAHGVVIIRIYVSKNPPANGDPNPPPPLIGVSPTNGTYVIVNKGSGRVLNVPENSTASGTQLIQWPLSSGRNEKWNITNLGGNYYSLVSVHSDKCVAATEASQPKYPAIVQRKYANRSSDRWQIIDSGGGYYRIINQSSDKCLTVEGASTLNGANIIQHDYHGGNNDLWQIHITPQ